MNYLKKTVCFFLFLLIFPIFSNTSYSLEIPKGYPECFKEDSNWNNFEENHKKKVGIKPGLSGLWQVSGRNRITSFDEIFSMDMYYIENWNIWLDIKILINTIPAIIKGTGY